MINFDEFDIEETKRGFCKDDIEFINFLNRRIAYDKFIANLKAEMGNPMGYYGVYWFSMETFCKDIQENGPEGKDSYITYGFNWLKSSEGIKYWRLISVEWFYNSSR